MDALLHELRNDVLRIWIPLIAGAALLVGLFSGIGIQGWRDSTLATTVTPTPVQVAPPRAPQESGAAISSAKKLHRQQDNTKFGRKRER